MLNKRTDNSAAGKYFRRILRSSEEFATPYILQIFGNVLLFKANTDESFTR